jgi:hypothetical protein
MAKSYLRKKKDKMPTKIEQLDEQTQVVESVATTDEGSVFSNLPERATNFIQLAEEVLPEGEYTTSVVSGDEEIANEPEAEVPPVERAPEKVFSIMGGEDDDEYYTYFAPYFTPMTQDPHKEWKLVMHNPFKRGSVSQEVLGEQVEVSYKTASIPGDIVFPVSQGVLVKEYAVEEIEWLSKTLEQAQNEIKDRVIMRYNQVVPSLINKMNTLDAQLKQVKQQSQQKRQPQQQQNDDLISL